MHHKRPASKGRDSSPDGISSPPSEDPPQHDQRQQPAPHAQDLLPRRRRRLVQQIDRLDLGLGWGHLAIAFGPHLLHLAPGHGHRQVVQDLLRDDAAAREADGHAGAGVRAGADHVKAFDVAVLAAGQVADEPADAAEDAGAQAGVERMGAAGAGRGAEGEDVEERVREAEDGAAVEIEFLLPGHGVIALLVQDEGLEVGARAGFDGGEDGATRERDHPRPILVLGGFVAFSVRQGGVVLDEMADGNEHHHALSSRRCGAGIDAAGHIDVEAGFGGDEVLLEDAVERFLVLVGQEDVMGFQLWDRAGQRPIERNTAAACRPIRVVNHHIRSQHLPSSQLDSHRRASRIVQQNLFHRGVQSEFHPFPCPNIDQRLDHAVKPPDGIPDALCQLRVLQQAVGARRIERTHAHIHAAEGEDPSQALSPEVFRGALPDALEGMQRQDVSQEQRPQHRQQALEVLQQDVFDAELVVAMTLLEEGQVALISILTLPLLDLALHDGQLTEGLVEEGGEEEKGGALIEAVAIGGVDQATPTAGEGVLFDDRDRKAGMGQACGSRGAADASAWYFGSVARRGLQPSGDRRDG
nr:hypothetical protein CFP56_13459 [Quercus suber]